MREQVIKIGNTLVGAAFILSSVTKAINVTAFAGTLDAFAGLLGMDWLYGLTQPAAFAVCVLECLTGLLMLHKRHARMASVACMAALLWFTYITYLNHTCQYGQIESCGCFGEVIHLSAAATFYKNLAMLTVLSATMLLRQKGTGQGPASQSGVRYLCAAVVASACMPLCSCLLLGKIGNTTYVLVYATVCVTSFSCVYAAHRMEVKA